MLKHVQISPLRNRSDSLSLRSTTSSSCASSICGSPEPPQSDLLRTTSRASSYSSLNETLPQTTIKVFTNCLKIDIEYKTLGIQWDTTSKEVISQLLKRLKMRHRDPRLFYLSMEVTVRRAGVKTILVLDDEARPAILQACHPKGDSRFCLQLKPGGLIRVHTSALQSSSQYKSLVISQETTSDELLCLLLSCYNSIEPVEQFSLYEVCPGQEYQRKLHPDDIPLRAQNERIQRGESCHFLVRRNPNYPRRRQLLPSLNDYKTTTNNIIRNTENGLASTDLMDCVSQQQQQQQQHQSTENLSSIKNTANEVNETVQSQATTVTATPATLTTNKNANTNNKILNNILGDFAKMMMTSKQNSTSTKISSLTNTVCTKCRNTFKTCDFCNKNSTAMILQQQQQPHQKLDKTSIMKLQSYNPVYNIREIRTVSHSFSSLGIDKKFLDIELDMISPITTKTTTSSSSTTLSRPNSFVIMKTPTKRISNNSKIIDVNGNNVHESTATTTTTTTTTQTLVKSIETTAGTTTTAVTNEEAVNNNPAKGLGHFIYI